MPKDNLLKGLNSQQKEAVTHIDGPALVVAGPGSGKTRVLTHRVAYLINNNNIHETKIMCATFTNKAAGEIRERVNKLLGSPSSKLPWSGTFHSMCAKILRKEGRKIGISPSYVIYDTADQEKVIKDILKDFGIDTKQIHPKAVLSTISSAKSELISPEEYKGYTHGHFQQTVAKVYPEYQKRLRQNEALDFDDLLAETVRLFRTEPKTLEKYQLQLKYILVDEYQDTNKAQYILTKLLSDKSKNLFVVGDMSQAIYGFRGADYRNILNFQKDHPKAKVYNLERNYRSTQNILDAAKNVIKNNSTHIPLDLWTNKGLGKKVVVFTGNNEIEEANFVIEEILNSLANGYKYKDIAVLYRTNAQSRNMEEHLIKSNIPYKIVGGLRFYSRKEIKDIIAYLRVIHNPKDTVSWERIINVPPRGIGDVTKEKIKESGWNIDITESKTGLPFNDWLKNKNKFSTVELMEEVLQKTDYIKWLDNGTDENLFRIENIKELKSVATQFLKLDEFLENVALIESADRLNTEGKNVVTLMTLHSSKGLEFPIAFITGMEEGLFPHSRSMMDMGELEEERRLCYVGITRAMDKILLTNTRSRLYFGSVQANIPSRFISEIPQELIEQRGSISPNPKLPNIEKFLDDLEYNRFDFTWD